MTLENTEDEALTADFVIELPNDFNGNVGMMPQITNVTSAKNFAMRRFYYADCQDATGTSLDIKST